MAKKETAVAYEPIKVGVDPRKDTPSKNSWLKLENGDAIKAAILVEIDEIVSTERCAIWLNEGDGISPVWIYTGEEDPSHDLGAVRQYVAYLPLLVDGEAKVWSIGKMVHQQLYDIADAAGEIKGMEVLIKRTGALLKTRYSVTPTGKRVKVADVPEVDVISMLGPLTSEGVRQLVAERLDCENYDEVLSKYRGHFKKGRGSKIKGEKKGGHLTPRYDDSVTLDEEEDSLEDIKLV